MLKLLPTFCDNTGSSCLATLMLTAGLNEG